MNIIVHGSIAYDRIMDFPGLFKDNILPDKIHNLSVSFYIDHVDELRGGTGGNIAYNLALLGESPILVTSVGKDFDEYEAFLDEKGITTEHIKRYDKELTASAAIITDRSNNQITAFNVGATAHPSEFDLSQYKGEETIMILAPANNLADTVRFIDECKQYGIRYIFDPGQTIPEFSAEQLIAGIEGAEVFTVNDYELELTMKITGWSEEDILNHTKVLIVTLGEHGSLMKTAEKIVKVPAFTQETLTDPTGAGDAYRAGLLKGMADGLRLKHMGRLGACAASFAIEKAGTQEHTFTMEEFRNRYKENLGVKSPI